MKSVVIVMLACVASPTLADVYRCQVGGKTIYQDIPCANARVIDNINGQAPSRLNQAQAMERAAREKELAQRWGETRTPQNSNSVQSTKTYVSPSPGASQNPLPTRTNGPDRYYDRPDRFNNRSSSGPMVIHKE